MRQQGEHHFHRDPEKSRRSSELSTLGTTSEPYQGLGFHYTLVRVTVVRVHDPNFRHFRPQGMDDIDTEQLMRREVSPSEIEAVEEEEDSEEEELMIPERNLGDT